MTRLLPLWLRCLLGIHVWAQTEKTKAYCLNCGKVKHLKVDGESLNPDT